VLLETGSRDGFSVDGSGISSGRELGEHGGSSGLLVLASAPQLSSTSKCQFNF